MRISYLKKCFNTSNCKEKEQEWGWQEGEREEVEGMREEKKEMKLDYHMGAVAEQQLSNTLHGSVCEAEQERFQKGARNDFIS